MNRFNSLFVLLLALAATTALTIGCAGKPEIVPSSGKRAPTSVSQVIIYEKQPKKYEVLGLVYVPVGGDVRWDDKGQAKAGFDKLKQGAAAVGANGLLLDIPETESEFVVVAGDGQQFYQLPMRNNPRRAVAQAIYVLEK